MYDLWHIWQTVGGAAAMPPVPWSSWASLGGGVKQVSAAQNSDGRLEAFGVGADSALWHIWQTVGGAAAMPPVPWSNWASLGGSVAQISAARNSDGRLEAFGVGTDGALWHIWQTVGGAAAMPPVPWSNWESLGGGVKQVAVARNPDGRLEVFGVGTDGALWHIWQTVGGAAAMPPVPWSNWESLGGGVVQVALAPNSDGRLEVFGVGTDGALWHIWQTVGGAAAMPPVPWSSWASLGGGVKQVSAAQNFDGRLEAFGVGTDGALWHIWQTVGGAAAMPPVPWSNWASLGGSVAQISAARNSDGRLEAFGVGTDGALWHIWQTVGGAAAMPPVPWSNWESLGVL